MKKANQLCNKVLFRYLMCLLLICAVILAFAVNTRMVFAETNSPKEIIGDATKKSGEASPYGLYTHLSLSINGADGRIWATVRNDFTLFPANVKVIVELYSSDTYYESYTDMELICMNSIEDLNMGNSIVAEGYTQGVQKYWQARMRYKIDNKVWESRTTGTMLYSADGEYLGLQ